MSLPEVAADLGYFATSSSSGSATPPAARRTSSPRPPGRPTSAARSPAPSSSSSTPAPRSRPSSATTARTRRPSRLLRRWTTARSARARDLIGKKIGVNTLGAHAEAVLDTYLQQERAHRRRRSSRSQLVALPPNNTEQALRSGRSTSARSAACSRTTRSPRGGLRRCSATTSCFGAFNGGQYVFRDDFIKKQPGDRRRRSSPAWPRPSSGSARHPAREVIARFTKIIDKRGRNEEHRQPRVLEERRRSPPRAA